MLRNTRETMRRLVMNRNVMCSLLVSKFEDEHRNVEVTLNSFYLFSIYSGVLTMEKQRSTSLGRKGM
jgi:hypothetical protein